MDVMNTEWMSLAFDGALVVAIVGLWAAWFVQAKQRKKVELLLQQASADLQAATILLDRLMAQLPKQHASVKEVEPKVEKQTLSAKEQAYIHRNIQKLHTPIPKKRAMKKPAQDSSMATKIMRLNREGLDMQTIAEQLSLPLAQVRLMLLLQTSKA